MQTAHENGFEPDKNLPVTNENRPKVFLVILAKQKQQTLPFFLDCIDALEYPKNCINLYIRTNNNTDKTKEMLDEWVSERRALYHSVTFDSTDVSDNVEQFGVHEWNAMRFRVLGNIRNLSLKEFLKTDSDFYFVVDVDNFIIPSTLSDLVSLNLPICAPLLRHSDPHRLYSNYHESIDDWGYFRASQRYYDILYRREIGCIEVPVVHCTYLIRRDIADSLTYIDGSDRHEYVVFSSSARAASIPQYICNQKIFGLLSLEEDPWPAIVQMSSSIKRTNQRWMPNRRKAQPSIANLSAILSEILPDNSNIPTYLDVLVAKISNETCSAPKIVSINKSSDLSATVRIDIEHDFRQFVYEYREFDIALIASLDMSSDKSWPYIVDETVRLLKRDGILLVAWRDSDYGVIAQLSQLLFLRSVRSPQLLFQHQIAEREWVLALKFNDESSNRPEKLGFSFGIITDGKREEYLNRFVDDIRSLDGLSQHNYEILVCGPYSAIGQVTGPDIRFIEQPSQFSDRPWITAKKNLIVRSANYETLIVAHNRYGFVKEFLLELVAYGADFDVLVPRQLVDDGRRFPDWVALADQFGNCRSSLLPFSEYHPNMYVNGGIIIAKKHVLEHTPWNELLFWGQAEDVEISRRFASRGILPRFARNVVVYTSNARDQYINWFEPAPVGYSGYHRASW